MLIHWAVEQGDVCLDAPLSDALPVLGRAAIGRLTLRDVLTHRAGVPRFPKDVPVDVLFDASESLACLARLQPHSMADTGRALSWAATPKRVLFIDPSSSDLSSCLTTVRRLLVLTII